MGKPKTLGSFLAVGAIVFGTLAASPVSAASAMRGAQLARQWCASCHVVSADQKRAQSDVPSFASIAKRPNFDAKLIAYFLLDPHPPMPNFGLTRAQANDLAAYIASQK
jgi:mono/diheme cytochrome c family protein